MIARLDERYRGIDESHVRAMLALNGCAHVEPRIADAIVGAALDRWAGSGMLGYRRAATGRRLFDPVEVMNVMRSAGRRGDPFLADHFVPTQRRLTEDFAAQAPSHRAARRFTVDMRRHFAPRGAKPGAPLRLRAPLPLAADVAELDVRPLVEGIDAARVTVRDGRLEVRGTASDAAEVTVGARVSFAMPAALDMRPAADTGAPGDHVAEHEAFAVVSDRVRRLAHTLAGADASPAAIVRGFWEALHATYALGSIHYDQLDGRAPCDSVLSSGRFDCRLAASLLVALCRARRIPARVVGGHFLYAPSPAPHYWAEVRVTDDGWTPIDFVGFDLEGSERDERWRDRFFGRLEPRLVTERMPHAFTGAPGVPIPTAWHVVTAAISGGATTTLLDLDGELVYSDAIRVSEVRP